MINKARKQFALITGASRGLGREFALELAQRGINVLLTALPGDNLNAFCNYLQEKFHVTAESFECDLTKEEEINQLICWVKQNYTINILVNNAGVGGTSEFEKTNFNFINKIILLNVRAMTMLTHQLLPELRKHSPSWILNVSSMASFSPIGYKTVYPASKVFVLNFTRGLQAELKGSGVFVSVVHPGPMKTNEDTTARIERQGRLGKIGLLSPEYMAQKTISRLFRKDEVILVGWMNKINWLLMKTIPVWLRLPLITQIVKREIIASNEKIKKHENISNGSQQLTRNKYYHRIA